MNFNNYIYNNIYHVKFSNYCNELIICSRNVSFFIYLENTINSNYNL